MTVGSLKKSAMSQSGAWKQMKEKTYSDIGIKQKATDSDMKHSYVFDHRSPDVPEFAIRMSDIRSSPESKPRASQAKARPDSQKGLKGSKKF